MIIFDVFQSWAISTVSICSHLDDITINKHEHSGILNMSINKSSRRQLFACYDKFLKLIERTDLIPATTDIFLIKDRPGLLIGGQIWTQIGSDWHQMG